MEYHDGDRDIVLLWGNRWTVGKPWQNIEKF